MVTSVDGKNVASQTVVSTFTDVITLELYISFIIFKIKMAIQSFYQYR